jgi:geranylgeranyl diphosphate synthase, type I
LTSLASPAPTWLAKYVEAIDSRVSEVFPAGSSALELAEKHALGGGKRVRAVLALLWCESVSGSYEEALPVAVAYELAHAAALIQDDILDESDFRRGERSIVGRHGLRPAILASNMLLAQVPREIAVYGSGAWGGETLRRLFELLGESFGDTILGEFLDLEMSQRDSVSQDDYEYMIRKKTGALVAASSASGVLVGGGPGKDAAVKAAYDFGEWLGMAYQVYDDVLDLIGDERTLGKPVFTDVRGGKKSIVLIHAMEKSDGGGRNVLGEMLGRRSSLSESEMEKVRSLLSETGSIEYAYGLAASYADRARRLVETMEGGGEKEKLLELSYYLASRKY